VCAAVERQSCYVLKTTDHHNTQKSYKYAVWQTLLDIGVHILAVESDVVLLENPILVYFCLFLIGYLYLSTMQYFDHTVDLNITFI
jgi:hypothetical protein